jgi:hypothetical protein
VQRATAGALRMTEVAEQSLPTAFNPQDETACHRTVADNHVGKFWERCMSWCQIDVCTVHESAFMFRLAPSPVCRCRRRWLASTWCIPMTILVAYQGASSRIRHDFVRGPDFNARGCCCNWFPIHVGAFRLAKSVTNCPRMTSMCLNSASGFGPAP